MSFNCVTMYFEPTMMVCIDDATDNLNFGDGQKELTFGKTYKVSADRTKDDRLYFRLVNDKNKSSDYLSSRFVTIEEFREFKLKELGI